MKDINQCGNVYKEFSFIVCLTIVTLISIATFRPHTAGLHQAIVSIYRVKLFVPLWLLVTGVSKFKIVKRTIILLPMGSRKINFTVESTVNVTGQN